MPNKITFKSGLPGLPEELKEFQLLAVEENSPFYLLQSTTEKEICFILINPFPVFPDYEFDLPPEEKNKLEIKAPQDLAVFCIVNAARGLKNATVNLLAPVVINTAKGLARQVVLQGEGYSLRQPLPAAESQGEE